MPTAFVPIKITAPNDKASGPSDQGSAMTRVALDLSASAPADWANYFNQRWQQHFYMMKRRARVSGSRLEIDCVLGELESDHLPELRKVIAETNDAYAKFHTTKQAAQTAEKLQQAAHAEELAKMKAQIKFD